MIPPLVKVVFRHQLVVLNLDLFMDGIAFEDDLLALYTLRKILGHILLDMLRIVPSFLNALQDRLLPQIANLFFFVLDLLDWLIDIAVIMTQL